MTEIPDHLLKRANQAAARARNMTRRPALTLDELRELRDMLRKIMEAHDVVLDKMGYATGAMSQNSYTPHDLLARINQMIGEMS